MLLRADLNVPLHDDQISDCTRIDAMLPTVKSLLSQNAAVLLVSHLGRPKPGKLEPKDSLGIVANMLGDKLRQKVPLIKDWIGGVDLPLGTVAVAENVRSLEGETSNDDSLAKKMAALCDVVVMDAFATAHRAHASTFGVIQHAKKACMGPLLDQEYQSIRKALESPEKPLLALVGGAKVSSKIHLLKSLMTKVNTLLIGGGMANTFLAATGVDVGESLCEKDCIEVALDILALAKSHGVSCPLPVDVRVIHGDFDPKAPVRMCGLNAIEAGDRIIDIGEQTEALWAQPIHEARTVIWNGPVGVFEIDAFAKGTEAISHMMANHKGTVLAGGGDTVAAINKFGIKDQLALISTGGGAFLQMLEGKPLPTIEALQKKSVNTH